MPPSENAVGTAVILDFMMIFNDGEEDKLTYSEIFNYITHDQYPGAYCRKRKH